MHVGRLASDLGTSRNPCASTRFQREHSGTLSMKPFVKVSSANTGPSASRYSVWKLDNRRSGMPGTVPSSGPIPLNSFEKTLTQASRQI
eukprot:4954306-Amphidinium_carterae.1